MIVAHAVYSNNTAVQKQITVLEREREREREREIFTYKDNEETEETRQYTQIEGRAPKEQEQGGGTEAKQRGKASNTALECQESQQTGHPSEEKKPHFQNRPYLLPHPPFHFP